MIAIFLVNKRPVEHRVTGLHNICSCDGAIYCLANIRSKLHCNSYKSRRITRIHYFFENFSICDAIGKTNADIFPR